MNQDSKYLLHKSPAKEQNTDVNQMIMSLVNKSNEKTVVNKVSGI